MRELRNFEFWLAVTLLTAALILSVLAYVYWYSLTFFAGSYLFIHWLGIAAATFVLILIPIHFVLRRKSPRSLKLLLKFHVLGNLSAFLVISLHFAQNVGRLAGAPQRLGDGVVLFLVLLLIVVTGFLVRYWTSAKWLRYSRILHRYMVIALIMVMLIHLLGFYWQTVPGNPQPSTSPFPSPSPTPTSSSSPLPSLSPSPSQTPSASPSPTASATPSPSPPIDLYPQEIRQYEGEYLSSILDFRENSIMGPQNLDKNTYRLTVTGLVNNKLEYTFNDVINGFQGYRKVVTIHCVEGWAVKILWEGFLLEDLLNEAGIKPEASMVIFYAYDGYSTSLPLDYILDKDILVAYKMNNVTLPPERGFPFELVAESKFGYKWIKWITEIELSNNKDYLGYWESRGYPNDASLPWV